MRAVIHLYLSNRNKYAYPLLALTHTAPARPGPAWRPPCTQRLGNVLSCFTLTPSSPYYTPTWMTGSSLASGKQPLRPQHSMSMDMMRSGATEEYSPGGTSVAEGRRFADVCIVARWGSKNPVTQLENVADDHAPAARSITTRLVE